VPIGLGRFAGEQADEMVGAVKEIPIARREGIYSEFVQYLDQRPAT